MTTTFLARAIAGLATTAIAVTGFATAASAEDAPATVSLTPAGVLTLPAADGVRDTTNVSVGTDVDTTVAFTVRALGGGTTIAELGSLAISGPGTEVEIPITGLPAGALELVATPTVGTPVTTPLTVGTGEPQNVDLWLTNTSIFTWTGGTPRSTYAKVSATDETGLTVPFTGTVTAAAGGKTYTAPVASATGDEASVYIGVSKLAAGTGSVTATVHGPSGTTHTSSPVTLLVRTTALKTVALSRSLSVVYPSRDGYKDSVKFTVASTSTTGATIPVTGKVTITRNGKVVKSWSLTSSAKWSGTWDGKVAGKIVGGTYYVKVAIKGPEGVTKTATTSVKVDTGRLVTKTLTVANKAKAVVTGFEAFDYLYDGICYTDYYKLGDFRCNSLDAYDYEDLALVAVGRSTIPTAVVNAQKYGATAKVSMHVTYLSGVAAWTYDTTEGGSAKVGALATGYNNLGALTLPTGSTRIYLTIGLGEYTTLAADTIAVIYTYKVMTH